MPKAIIINTCVDCPNYFINRYCKVLAQQLTITEEENIPKDCPLPEMIE